MKLAVLGGSFNPIHIGHLALADAVCTELGYDRLLFVPTFIPPHKVMADTLAAERRLEMVRLACSGDGRFGVESCEIDRGGVSYTYDTVCTLEQKYAGELEDRIGLVMGEDLVPGFHLWHRAEELSRKCRIIVARRPASTQDMSHSNTPKGKYANLKQGPDVGLAEGLEKGLAEGPGGVADASGAFGASGELFSGALFIHNIELRISSTQIRTRAAEGKAFRYLVPDAVFEYIKKGRLYGK